jgi:phage terminase large subunit-like protein
MPWQQYVADVILEVDPGTGRLAYGEWGLTVPRQSGKSTFVEAKATHRCSATGFFGPRQHVVYTAQTRLKAREKWEEDFVSDLEAARAFRGRFRVHKGNGNEHVRFANRSRFGLEAATEKAGHGSTLDEAFIDEAFAHPDSRLEQAFGPAMITRLNKQLAWISTAGWLGASVYLTEKVDLGRLVAAEGRRRGIAYFEWSAPDDAAPGDPATWLGCMPALCPDPPCRCGGGEWRHTITMDAIRGEYEKARDSGKLNEFRRAYLNQWVPKDAAAEEWGVIGEDAWSASVARGGLL